MQVAIDGVLVNYSTIGHQNETLLILHGWKGDITQWTKVAEELKERFKCILIDLPGHGASTKSSTDFDTYDYAEFVIKFLSKLNIKDPLTLLGHSMGGRIAIVLTANNMLPVKQLILVDSAGIEKRSFSTKLKIVLFKLGKIILAPIIGKDKLEKLKGTVLKGTNYSTAGNMRETLKRIVNDDLTHLLPKIKVPTLIIWGDRDEILDPKYAKLFKNHIQNSKVRIVWGAEHRPHLSKPDDFINILKEEL